MSQFKIRYDDLESQKNPLKKISREIDDLADDIKHIRREMDTETSSISSLERKLYRYELTLENLAEDIKQYSSVLEDISEAYKKSEKDVYSSIGEVTSNIQSESVTNMWMEALGYDVLGGLLLTNPGWLISNTAKFLATDKDMQELVCGGIVDEVFDLDIIKDSVCKYGDKILDRAYYVLEIDPKLSLSMNTKVVNTKWAEKILGGTTAFDVGCFVVGAAMEGIENYKEHGGLNFDSIGANVVETGMDVAIGLLSKGIAGFAVGALGISVAPGVIVAGGTIALSVGANWLSRKIFDKDLGECVSDFLFGDGDGEEKTDGLFDKMAEVYNDMVNAPGTGSFIWPSYD